MMKTCHYFISMFKNSFNDFLYLIDDEHWNQIAEFRKFLQRIHNDRLVFIDETAIYAIMPPRRTLVAPGYQTLIIVEKPSAYAVYYDFIGVINGLTKL